MPDSSKIMIKSDSDSETRICPMFSKLKITSDSVTRSSSSSSSSSSRCCTGDIDPQWWKMDCCMRWVFSFFLNRWGSSYRVRMSTGSKFHSCGDEMEKPRRPVRSLRKRGTKSWTCAADRRLRLAGTSLIGRQSLAKYSEAWPTRQFLVMTFILKRIRAWIGSQWRSCRIAAEIGSYFPSFRIRRAEEFRTDWRWPRRYVLVP